MTRLLLLKSQMNTVFELIAACGLDPAQFAWHQVASQFSKDVIHKLVYLNSSYYFRFDIHNGSHFSRYSPGDDINTEEHPAGGWDTQAFLVQRWLDHLVRELQAPDLWQAIADEKSLSDASSQNAENSLFSADEIKRIDQNLPEIKEKLLAAQEFTPQQRQYLDSNFAYLKDASTRMGRKDWIIIVVGTLTNIIITLPLTSAVARDLFHIAGLVLNGF